MPPHYPGPQQHTQAGLWGTAWRRPLSPFIFSHPLQPSTFPFCQVNQQLFEDQQQMLEAEVERLSGLVQVNKCGVGGWPGWSG